MSKRLPCKTHLALEVEEATGLPQMVSNLAEVLPGECSGQISPMAHRIALNQVARGGLVNSFAQAQTGQLEV